MDQQVDEILQQEAPIKREEIIKNNSTTGAQVIPKGAKFLANLYLKPVLQRIPGIYTILFLILCFFGPIYTPMLYSIYFAWIQLYFLWSTFRSFISALNVYYSVVGHTKTIWKDLYLESVKSRPSDNPIPFEDVKHIIIIPQYKEELDTMFETLDVLASHSMARLNYTICLAMEQSENESPEKASFLISKYTDQFFIITATFHPKGLTGEIRGKSSNTAWAAKQILQECDQQAIKYQVFTVMDADTCFAADYFQAVSYYYSTATEQERSVMFFSTPTLFDRNANSVPFLVRVYDMQWSLGVMSNFYPFSKKQAPCSAYSLSVKLASSVGLWDANAEAMGEDLHMFLKCFFSTQGHLKIQPIYSPASQCNIDGSTYFQGISARYIQSKRHMWAALDVGYTIRRSLFGLISPGYDTPTSSRKVEKIAMSRTVLTSNSRCSVRSQLLDFFFKAYSVVFTMVEGHFFVTQALIMIATSSVLIPPGIFPGIADPYFSAFNALPVNSALYWLNMNANFFRIPATLFYILAVVFYEKYQAWCGLERWKQYSEKLGKRSKLQFSRPWYSVFDWFAFPITGVLFLVIPQLYVHVKQLFTDNLDYVVAAKPSVSSSLDGDKPAQLAKEGSAVTIVVV